MTSADSCAQIFLRNVGGELAQLNQAASGTEASSAGRPNMAAAHEAVRTAWGQIESFLRHSCSEPHAACCAPQRQPG